MGNPKDDALAEPPSPSLSTPLASSPSSAVQLQETYSPVHGPGNPNPPFQRFFDEDPPELQDSDLPPLYTDLDHNLHTPVDPLLPRNTPALSIEPFFISTRTDTVNYIDRRLESDPDFLMSQLEILAASPPRPFVTIRGHHTETKQKGDKSETNEVIDFALEIELTHLLFTDIASQKSWRQLVTAGNFEKVRRGTVFATRAPGFGGSGIATDDGQPSPLEWCHRFCASRAGLRVFSLERRVVGWDFDVVRCKLETLVRDTNYRGTLTIEFPIRNSRVDIYNNCLTNRWRLTTWICWLFMLSLLFIFTWPWIFFRTKRFETVSAVWPMSKDGRYAAMSEQRWYNMWARTIQRAVLRRRQGVLDQGDVQLAEEPEARAEGALGTIQAGLEAMGAINQSFGWGGDTNGRSIGIGRRIAGTTC